MLDLIQLLGSDLGMVRTLVLAGTGLILVNVLTHRLVAQASFRARRREQVARNLKPLLRATADLISRLVEILITHKRAVVEAISAYDPAGLDTRLDSAIQTSADLNRHETTAYRLINYLTLANYFGRETSGIAPFPVLDRAEYFLQHKVAVGLRGNLYNMNFLSTELQEDLATSYLECDRTLRATDLSSGIFLAHVKAKKYPRDFFRRALDLLGVVPPFAHSQDAIDRSKKEWKHTLVLAHLAIYLIDFYQELGNDPQWEEHRVFLVRLVRQWNADASKHRYLYEPGDLESADYLRTFPARRTSRESSLYSLPSLFGLRDALSRTGKWITLNLRGARFGRRHHPKRLKSWGTRIKLGKRSFDIRWDSDLWEVYTNVRSCLGLRLLEM